MKLSVIVFVFDRENYVLDALGSVFNQTAEQSCYEVLVISNIKLEKVENKYKDKNFKIIYTDETSLWSKIKIAYSISKGEIISFLEDDDYWESDKIIRVIKLFESNRELSFYHNGFTFIIGDNKHQLSNQSKNANSFVYAKANTENSFPLLLKKRADYNLSSISIRKAYFNINLLYDLKNLFIDGAIFLICLSSGHEMCADDLKLTFVRIHKDNNSGKVKNISDQLERDELSILTANFMSGRYEKNVVEFLINEMAVNYLIRYQMAKRKMAKHFIMYLISGIRGKIFPRNYVLVKSISYIIYKRFAYFLQNSFHER